MARRPPSYTELVYQVLRESPEPLTITEILDRVGERRPVTTRNPMRTISSALGQGWALVRMPDGRYAYLPNVIGGSVLRLPLTESKPANHPLVYPLEVRLALFPTFFETAARQDLSAARVTLPNGEEVPLLHDTPGRWEPGSPMPEGLSRYLISRRAAPGDALIVRVVDAAERRYALDWEPRRKRDDAAIAARNKDLADAAAEMLRRERSMPLDPDTIRDLLVRGAYRGDVAPDLFDEVLGADPRFRKIGFLGDWTYVAEMSAEELAAFEEQGRVMDEIWEKHIAPIQRAAVEEQLAAARPSMMERAMADMRAYLDAQEYETPEELNEILQNALAAGGFPRREPRTPLERAQDLVYDAWDTSDRRERIRLAQEALSISPDCADAYVILAQETARSAEEAEPLYAQGVAAGERAIGPELFEEAVGQFWGVLETRPYMRALEGLSQALWALDRREEAIARAQEMLRLNPDDNQGMRYTLLGWLLPAGRDEEAGALLEAYADDGAATWLYGQALHAFRREGDSRRSRRLLTEALRENPYVAGYLLGAWELPDRPPAAFGPGDEGEAQVVLLEQGHAWIETDGALEWLARRAR